ncbi:aldo/keto reductase [Tenacibaculum ovolyticum]|uniref:aldo/keto reductase n=1 Tax=Tenacibaculum ovolyticum TaxID=104270 RepID=UPI003BAC4667
MIKKSNINGLELSRVGLGCMRLSMNRTGASIDRKQSITTIHKALDSGINLLNTGDFYGNGDNEKLIADALKGYNRDRAFISLKYGTFSNMMKAGIIDVGPKNVKKYITTSLKRLNVDYVDLYQPARVDIGIPVEETIGAISDLVKEGLVRHIGLSEVDTDTLKKANTTHPISLVEMCYSIIDETIESELLKTVRELGIGLVAFGVLGLGKLFKSEGDILVKTIHEIASEKNISVSQVAHAWILTKGEDVIPLIGSKNVVQLEDSLASVNVALNSEDLHKIENAQKKSKIVGTAMPKMTINNGILIR